MQRPAVVPSLLRSATPLIAGRIVSATVTFFLPVVLARRFAPVDYGTYKQFFLVAATAFLMAQIGLPASLYYFLPRGGAERGRYLVLSLLLLAGLGLAAAGLMLVAAPLLAHRFSNPRFAELAPPLAVYVWLMMAAAPLEVSLTANGRTGWAAVGYVLSDATRTAAILGPILAGYGLGGLAWAACGFAGLRVIAAWWLALSGAVAPPLMPTWATVRAMLRYALPFAGAVVLSVAQLQLPQYVVAAMVPTAIYAIFTVGVLQLPVAEMLYTPIAEVMMVRLSAAKPAEAPAIFREAMSRLTMFFLPLATFLWAIGPVLIPTLYTRQYEAAVPIFVIGSAEVLLNMIPVDGLLRSLDATRSIFWINLARLSFAILAVPLGLILAGLEGAIAAHLLAQLFGKTLLLRVAAHKLGVRSWQLIAPGPVATWAIRGAALYAGLSALRVWGPWHGWPYLLAASALAGTAWIAVLVVTGEANVFGRVPVPAATIAPGSAESSLGA